MIELQNDNLAVSFPDVHPGAVLNIGFQRTLRIPDDGRDYPLPPGLGAFPLRHIDDHPQNVPANWLDRGGVLLPMYQAEALWIMFDGEYLQKHGTQYPFAIKIATGKISAITGENWRAGLSRNPQNYCVSPTQPWLDGYCVEKGIIRQFVAMPLGEGYSVEEQLTGEAEFGGIQIEVFPMKRAVFERRFPVVRHGVRFRRVMDETCLCASDTTLGMGLAPGGRMRQEIYDDPYSIHDWDTEHSGRCFVHLVNSVTWKYITGQRPPTKPPTAKDYSHAGMPWFDYYDADAKALEGSSVLAKVKTVLQKGKEKREHPLPENESVSDPKIIQLRAGLRPNQVREANFN
jgi:hypothetical protein